MPTAPKTVQLAAIIGDSPTFDNKFFRLFKSRIETKGEWRMEPMLAIRRRSLDSPFTIRNILHMTSQAAPTAIAADEQPLMR